MGNMINESEVPLEEKLLVRRKKPIASPVGAIPEE